MQMRSLKISALWTFWQNPWLSCTNSNGVYIGDMDMFVGGQVLAGNQLRHGQWMSREYKYIIMCPHALDLVLWVVFDTKTSKCGNWFPITFDIIGTRDIIEINWIFGSSGTEAKLGIFDFNRFNIRFHFSIACPLSKANERKCRISTVKLFHFNDLFDQ